MRSQQTRWLTDDEQLAWRAFLTACQTLFATVEGQLLRDSDIPHGYYEILVRLSEAPDRSLNVHQVCMIGGRFKLKRCKAHDTNAEIPLPSRSIPLITYDL